MMKGKEIRIVSLLVLDVGFFLLEAIVGYSVHSLALVADSFHMLNDIISLVIALWAVKVKNNKPADGKYTYGWQRAEILGALINAVFLLALCFTIIIEAIQRFFEPQELKSPKLVLIVGAAGLLSNVLGLALFHEHGHSHGGLGGHSHSHKDSGHSHADIDEESHIGSSPEANAKGNSLVTHGNESSSNITDYFPDTVVGRLSANDENSPLLNKHNRDHSSTHQHGSSTKKKSMNMEGVFLHVLGDALGNVGVIITGLFIWKTDFSWRFYTDPLVSLIITLIIFSSALPLCLRASKILLQAAPAEVDSNKVLSEIVRLDDVKSVHDFHIWGLNEDILIASLHLELNRNASQDTPQDIEYLDKATFTRVVTSVREILHHYGIHSATIQPEFYTNNEPVLNRKASAYGATQAICSVDGASGCNNEVCLK